MTLAGISAYRNHGMPLWVSVAGISGANTAPTSAALSSQPSTTDARIIGDK